MRLESEIRDRKNQLIEQMNSKKNDMEHTEIYGQLKKDNPLFVAEWMNGARESLLEIYLLSWILDEPIAKDIYELMRL